MMFYEDILYISYHKYIKCNFWLLICIAKNFMWTILKGNFLNMLPFFAPPDFQILSYHNKPYINWNIIYSDFNTFTLMTGFAVQGHIYICHFLLYFCIVNVKTII